MRIVGIDYGTKRVGVALSDDGGRLAFPHTTIKNDNNLIEEISLIVNQYEVELIVVGDSKDYKMKDNLIMGQVKDFIEDLKLDMDIKVELHPEFMTSTQVERTNYQITKQPGRKDGKEQKAKQVDAQAAAIMLQSYIDSSK